MSGATKRPWSVKEITHRDAVGAVRSRSILILDATGRRVARISMAGTDTARRESAALIVRAVNALPVLIKGLQAVHGLILDSGGVEGLHANGDPAPWDELRTGGNFEEWLMDFDAALKLAEGE